MIQTLSVTDPKNTVVSWASRTIKEPRDFTFGPGLTILWGPNGCGKSTLLTLMARLSCSEQGGVSTITEHALRHFERDRKPLSGAHLISDGSAVRYLNTSQKIGLSCGQLDDDFFGEGMLNAMERGSEGQLTLKALHEQLAPWPPTVENKLRGVNDFWAPMLAFAKEQLEQKIEVGPMTILIDEAEAHLSIPNQAKVWKAISAVATQCQVIVASHSVFALNVKGATYMDMKPGYLTQCQKVVSKLKIGK